MVPIPHEVDGLNEVLALYGIGLHRTVYAKTFKINSLASPFLDFAKPHNSQGCVSFLAASRTERQEITTSLDCFLLIFQWVNATSDSYACAFPL
jgi:hypothetical protein